MSRTIAVLPVLLSNILLSQSLVLAAGTIVIDPDAFPSGTILNNAFPGVTLSAHDLPVGAVLPNDQVLSVTSPFVTTGTRAFGHQPGPDATWGNGAFEYLRAEFASGRLMLNGNAADQLLGTMLAPREAAPMPAMAPAESDA